MFHENVEERSEMKRKDEVVAMVTGFISWYLLHDGDIFVSMVSFATRGRDVH